MDKEQAMSFQNGDSSSRITMATAPPEIITNIFSFLDQPSLKACIQVSRLWYTTGQPLSWRKCSITLAQLRALRERSHLNDKMISFCMNSHYIQFLTITKPRLLGVGLSRLSEPERTLDLRNLNRLVLSFKVMMFQEISPDIRGILLQCPGIQDLEVNIEDVLGPTICIEPLLKHTTNKVKRLKVSGNIEIDPTGIFQLLSDAHSRYQQQKGQTDCSLDDGCGQLEELILWNQTWNTERILRLPEFRHAHDMLPLRSLTLVDFMIEDVYLVSLDPHESRLVDDPVLQILRRCPHLEKLHVTFDISKIIDDTSRLEFSKALNMKREEGPGNMLNAPRDYVKIMIASCPKLRDIELGMMRHLNTHRWNEMTRAYGQQLESFSVWGNHRCFDDSAFMNLIEHPLTCLSTDRPHRLTRLNINGLSGLRDCAWVALQQLPHLKEFRARDVPLDARKLVMKDGWICGGLELLEI
ncbi:hypothetical protein BGX31_001983, partial [Mortierella sp. GBA43]